MLETNRLGALKLELFGINPAFNHTNLTGRVRAIQLAPVQLGTNWVLALRLDTNAPPATNVSTSSVVAGGVSCRGRRPTTGRRAVTASDIMLKESSVTTMASAPKKDAADPDPATFQSTNRSIAPDAQSARNTSTAPLAVRREIGRAHV